MFLKKEGIHYFLNFYRSKYYDYNQYLLTTDDGRFIFINKQSMKELKKGTITTKNIYHGLEDKGIIITPQNISDNIKKIKQRYQFLFNGTSLHIVIPTTRCNLSCPYCFADPENISADKNLHDMSEETAKKTIRYIMNSPNKAITIEFTGGEPTARFDLVKLMIEYAETLNTYYKKDLKFTIVTNLTMMNEEMANYFIKHNVGICTSLDGPEIVNDANRIIKGANEKSIGTYKTVEKWIKRINELYKENNIEKNVNALMTITRYSFKYYKEILDTYAQLKIYYVDIRAMMYIGRSTKTINDPNQYPYEEFTQFYQNCINYIKYLNDKGIPMQDRMDDLYKKKIYEQTPTYHVDYESPWGGGIGSMTYSPQGTIYACHESIGKDEFKLGTIDTPWRELFTTEEMGESVLSSMLEGNPLCDTCVYKPYCGTSPIENFFSQKKLHFYPPKTVHHHETIFHAKNNFDKELQKIIEKDREKKISTINLCANENNSIFPEKNQGIDKFRKILKFHFQKKEINPLNREIEFAQTLQKKKINKNKMDYKCLNVDKEEIETEIDLLNKCELNQKIFDLLKNLLINNLLGGNYHIGHLSFPNDERRTIYISITKHNKDIIIKYLNIPNKLHIEFENASMISIDSINKTITNYKIYSKINKNKLKKIYKNNIIEKLSSKDIFLTKRYDSKFNLQTYRFDPKHNKKDSEFYPREFKNLCENKTIFPYRITFEYNLQGELIKNSFYYFNSE